MEIIRLLLSLINLYEFSSWPTARRLGHLMLDCGGSYHLQTSAMMGTSSNHVMQISQTYLSSKLSPWFQTAAPGFIFEDS
jgi:hypothetical protein